MTGTSSGGSFTLRVNHYSVNDFSAKYFPDNYLILGKTDHIISLYNSANRPDF